MRQTKRIIAPVLVAALLAAGCGGAPSAVGPGTAQQAAARHAGLDVTVLRQVHFDYAPVDTPEALVKTGRHDVIASGTVAGIRQGDAVAEGSTDQQPALHVVMKVKVGETFRSKGQVVDGHVYVVLWQGPRYNDPQGTPEFSLAHWQQAIPQGTPVMLFLSETAGGPRHGVPANARPMTPDVQGLILDDAGTLVNGLEEFAGQWTRLKSMTELSQRVRAAVK